MATTRIENLPLEWVRSFEAAGRTGNFTAAAQEMNLTQAAVSQRISNLENHLGTQLFIRESRGVTLTIEGEAWLPHVTRAIYALKRSAEELFGKPLKQILISASASINQLWITPRLAKLSHGAIYQISVTTMNIDSDFAKAHASIEIRYGTGDWPKHLSQRLFREEMTPIATPELLSTKKDWRDLPIIAVSGPRPGWQEWGEHINDTAPFLPNYRFDSFVAALAAARQGLGIILGSLPLCHQEIENGALEIISQETIKLDAGYWMVSDQKRLSQTQWGEVVDCLTS